MAYDDEFDDENDSNDEERAPLSPAIRKQLRDQEKALKEAAKDREEMKALRGEIAFAKAGIPEDGPAKYFRKGYDGEFTVEAIKAAAIADGILGQPNTGNEPDTEDENLAAELAASRRAAASTGGTSGTTPDAAQLFMEQLRATDNPEDVMKIVRGPEGQSLGLLSNRDEY